LDLKKHNKFINKDTTLYEFLEFILNTIEDEFKEYILSGGFIAYLDETKVSTRFKIISSVGKFLNSNNIKIISAKEIDKLSTVFMTKEPLVKENLYIDIVNKNSQDIFIYLEFDTILDKTEQIKVTNYFTILNRLIKNTNWGENMNTIVQRIEELPALSKTIIDTLNFSTKSDKTAEELVEILSTDPLIIATLLKTINSAIFGFRNEIETLENLIYLMGVDFTISIVLANSIQDSVSIDISAYGISQEEFKDFLALKIKFMTSWLRTKHPEIQKKLYLPLILQDLGKFIISKELSSTNKAQKFLSEIKEKPYSIDKIERKYSSYTSTEITVLILEHWNLNKTILDSLNGNCKELSSMLTLINTIFNIIKPLDDSFIQNALTQAKELNLDIDLLRKQIDLVKKDI